MQCTFTQIVHRLRRGKYHFSHYVTICSHMAYYNVLNTFKLHVYAIL